MWKLILAGTTALALTGSSLVFAQQSTSKPDAAKPEAASPPADKAAAGDAAKSSDKSPDEAGTSRLDIRLAVFKAGLSLTDAQEKHWDKFATAVEDAAKFRAGQREARRTAQRPADPVARMHRRANALAERAEVLKRLAEAAQPLYGSLDENQKQRFAVLMRVLGPRRPGAVALQRGMRRGYGPGYHHGRPFAGQGPMDLTVRVAGITAPADRVAGRTAVRMAAKASTAIAVTGTTGTIAAAINRAAAMMGIIAATNRAVETTGIIAVAINRAATMTAIRIACPMAACPRARCRTVAVCRTATCRCVAGPTTACRAARSAIRNPAAIIPAITPAPATRTPAIRPPIRVKAAPTTARTPAMRWPPMSLLPALTRPPTARPMRLPPRAILTTTMTTTTRSSGSILTFASRC